MHFRHSISLLGALLLVSAIVFPTSGLWAQASISSTSNTPFVAAIIPVVDGSGDFVGGVLVDTKGVVSRTKVDEGDLAASRKALLSGQGQNKLRVVSLARLEKEFASRFEKKDAIPEDMLFLAGLQRIEYVLAVPDEHDILLAGPGEDWRIDSSGTAVGLTSGRPAMRLDDLLEAFRTAQAAAEGRGISCSIDPTEEGLARMQQLLRGRNLKFNARTTELLRQAVGPQRITVTGISPDSHYARVLVAADYMMKRLAMGLEAAPIEDMPSYLELLKDNNQQVNQSASPRWWMAVDYSPLRHTADGLSWQIRGPGVKALTEDAYIDKSGERVVTGKSDDVAQRWASTMSKRYDELAVAMPIFGELRNCMDLSVVAAIVWHNDLHGRADAPLSIVVEGKKARGPKYEVPTTVDSHISVVRAGKEWLVGVSGGVDVDSWSVLAATEESTAPVLTTNMPPSGWWWQVE